MVNVLVDGGRVKLDFGPTSDPDETRRVAAQLKQRERGPTLRQQVEELLVGTLAGSTTTELAVATGTDSSQVRRELRALRSDGAAQSDDGNPPRWRLT